MPFDSPEAAELNRAIFETIYHAAVQVCVCVWALCVPVIGWMGRAQLHRSLSHI